MACICQECGEKYKVDIMIDSKIWESISPKGNRSGLLCGKCIINKLEALGYGAFYLYREEEGV